MGNKYEIAIGSWNKPFEEKDAGGKHKWHPIKAKGD